MGMKRVQKQKQQQQQAKENAKQVEEAAKAAAKEKEAKVNSNIVLARNKKRLELQKQQKEEEAFAFDAPPPISSSSSPLSSQPLPSAIVGAINVNSSVAALLRDSITEASQLCEATYLISPPVAFITAMKYENEAEFIESGSTSTDVSTNDEDVVVVVGGDDVENEDDNSEDVSATFVRSWLQYTLVELLKNAMAATVEQNPDIVNALVGDEFDLEELEDDNDGDIHKLQQQQQQHQPPLLLPSLYVHIYEDTTSENVIIKLYDQGGGISNNNY